MIEQLVECDFQIVPLGRVAMVVVAIAVVDPAVIANHAPAIEHESLRRGVAADRLQNLLSRSNKAGNVRLNCF